MMCRLIFLKLILILAQQVVCSTELDELAQNFFDNLQIQLRHEQQEAAIGRNESIAFMDKQIANFVDMMRSRQEASNRRQRRQVVQVNAPEKFDIYLLEGITPIGQIPVRKPKDIVLFQQPSGIAGKDATWYAAALEGSDVLVVFKWMKGKFSKFVQLAVHNGTRLGVYTTPKEGTFIVVAEETRKDVVFLDKTPIYRFTPGEKLEKLHNLHLDYASDIAIWAFNGETFMVVTQQFTSSNEERICATESNIYKWLGSHFDIVQNLESSCAVRATPFTIGKSRFLAIANNEDSTGNGEVYSEIFKYDLESEKFVSHQKLMTRGAADIKFFAFRSGIQQENFIVVANTRDSDSNGTQINNARSIAYKYVDGYFLPFQSFDLVAPTEWLPSIGPNGEFVLMVACKFEGLKFYQYNGWVFQPTKFQYTNGALSPGIQSLRSYVFEGKSIIVVANDNRAHDDEFNMFQLHFNLENPVEKHYHRILTWCESHRNELREMGKFQAKKKRRNVVNLRTIEADLSNGTNAMNNLAFLELQLENQQLQVDNIRRKINGSRAHPEFVEFNGDILARNVIINNEIIFNDLIAKTLNTVDVVDFLSGVLKIDGRNELSLPRLQIESANVQHFGEIATINGRSPSDLLHVNLENVAVDELIVRGNLITPKLNVDGKINNQHFNSSNILLKEGEQVFNGDLNVESMRVQNTNAIFLNNLNLSHQSSPSESIKVHEVENLKVRDLTIVGYINNVDIPTLNQYTLKINGNQELTGEFIFDTLEFNNLHTEELNGFNIPNDLVQITQGEYFVRSDVKFTDDLNANNLTVTINLNNIGVYDDLTLDALLKNSSEIQFVKGQKTVSNVKLQKPMQLRGRIKNETLQALNPITNIEIPIEIFENILIHGDVTIESLVDCIDVTTEDLEFSIEKLREEGLKISDTNIPVELNFAQQLNTYEIFADKINGVDTRKWVVNGNNETQYLKGWKTFDGDLIISGNTNLHIVNDINMPELNMNVLKIEGDQTITGKHVFKNIVTGAVRSNQLVLNSSKPMDAMMMRNGNEQKIASAIIGQLVVSGKLSAQNVQVENTLNGFNFVEMLQDTLFKNDNTRITGSKIFDNLSVDNLLSRKTINMNRIPNLIVRGEAITGSDMFIEFPDEIAVETIKFKNYLNNLSAESFGNNWLDGTPGQKLAGDHFLDKVEVSGQLFIDSNRINDVNLWQLKENTVKIDEEFDFDEVTFNEDVTSLAEIKLRGHIENLDINSIVADNGEDLWIDGLTFRESLTVLNPINVDATFNGFNFTHLCEYANPEAHETPKNLIVEGDAMVLKTPIIDSINGRNLERLTSSIWFNNVVANLTSDLQMNYVNFNEEVIVDGYVCETSLGWLQDNYFSKTRNQTIMASIYFQEGVNVKGNLVAPKANVGGTVNEIALNEFLRSAILQGWEQTFEDPLLVETMKVDSIDGNFKVNGNNLETDVMRYDGENIVTGKSYIRKVDAETLNVDRDFKVQGVELKDWTINGILRKGSYQLNGYLTFTNFTVFEQGIGLTGLLNNNKFIEEKILLKSKPQIVTGHKAFNTIHSSLVIKNMKLKGTLNDIHISDLVQNQALASDDNVFANELNFHTSLTAQNINFDGLFQGVNVSQMLHNLTTTAFVENYIENYTKLKKAATTVQKSLDNQAKYLQYFRTMQTFGTLVDLRLIRNQQDTLHIATMRRLNYTSIVDFFKWSSPPGIFNIDTAMKEISFAEPITNWAALEYDFGSYWYIEIEYHDEFGNKRMGNVLKANNRSEYEIIEYIPSNGTKTVLPLFLPTTQKTCLLMVHMSNNFMDIQCETEKRMKLHQRIPATNLLQVKVAHFENKLEIIGIEKPDASLNTNPAVVIWRYDKNTELFNETQRIFTFTPISLSTAYFNGDHYLSIASSHLHNTQYAGQIDIKKYDPVKEKYVDWQVFQASDPMQVELAVLPSNELLLYVQRNGPTETLHVYQYNGISKFQPRGTISSLENCNSFLPFTDHKLKEHFIIATCNGQFDIIQTIFRS